ncbi:MAG: SDR family oxidoreductase [Gammaproteobacteria bacterium]
MILVTGVTGKTGGEVARQLAAAGVPFRALVRSPDKADALRALGAELVIGDVADDDLLTRALEGIDRAFLVMPNGEQQLTLENRFTYRAQRAGVIHLVNLSSLESVPESTNPITRMHVASEQFIRESGMSWTMIRPTFFMQTFLGSAAAIRDRGIISMPAGQGTIAPTDLRDVAEVIVQVLTQPGHENRSYDLTGPELLTLTEVARTFSRVLGREINYVDQPMPEFQARLASVKLAPWRIDAVCKEFEAIAAGAIDHTTGTMAQLLGRPPVSLEQFIRDHIALYR